jgi:hypothetical protein
VPLAAPEKLPGKTSASAKAAAKRKMPSSIRKQVKVGGKSSTAGKASQISALLTKRKRNEIAASSQKGIL